MKSEDEDWVRTLAGHAPDATGEATMLRAAILADEQARVGTLADVAGDDDEAYARLRAALGDEPAGVRARRMGAPFALAAGLALAALGIGVLLPERIEQVYPPPPGVRGELAVAEVRSETPRRDAEMFAAALVDAQIQAYLHQDAQVFVVDFRLIASDLERVRPLLEGHGLQAAAGNFRIRYAPR